jgi:nicotinamide-nucleotide amidase
MKTEIITIGDEVLRGEIAESNSLFLSRQLSAVGLEPWRISVLPDDVGTVSQELRAAVDRSAIIIVTGGLGPTVDDVTKEAVVKALGLETEYRADIVESIERRFVEFGKRMPDSYREQGEIPAAAGIMPNEVGLAVGLEIRSGDARLYLLPGVPEEMREMFRRTVMPRLKLSRGEARIRLRTFGLVETEVEERLRASLGRDHMVSISIISAPEGVDIYLPGSVASTGSAEEIVRAMGSYLYGEGDVSLAGITVKLLLNRGLSLAVAESVTGGLLASTVVSVPGASGCFREGFITYSNEAKTERIGVGAATLDRCGAVSEEVCIEMAKGARERSGAEIAVSTTGIAGPAGATEGKPVGLCFVGLAAPHVLYCRRLRLPGDRGFVRRRAVYSALDLLRLYLVAARERLDALIVGDAQRLHGDDAS